MSIRRLNLALVGVGIGLLIGLLILMVPSGLYGVDLLTYLAAGERLNAGHSLYQLSPGDRPVFIDPTYWTSPLLSPPTIAVLWRPLAALGPELGSYIWWAASCASLLATLVLLWRRQPLLTGVALIVLIVPIAHAIAVANVNSMLVLGLVLVWRAWARGNDGEAGGISGLMAAVKLTPVILVWWLLVTNRWRATLVALLTILAMFLIGLVGAGIQAHFDYVAMMRNPSSMDIYPQSLAHVATMLGVPDEWARLVSWAAAGAGVVAILILRNRPAWGFAVAILTMIFGSPTVTTTWFVLLLALLAPIAYPRVDGVEGNAEPVPVP